MSRRSQDIPIRPRYVLDEATEDADVLEKPRPRRALSNVGTVSGSQNKVGKNDMASSYSEIPFLAQYADAVPPQALDSETSSDGTSKLQDRKAIPKKNNDNLVDKTRKEPSDYNGKDDENEEEDDFEDNSKDSSKNTESREKQKRPKSLQYDSSFPYELERTASNDGEMRHFAAGNFDDKFRSASPHSRRENVNSGSHNSTPSTSTGSMLTRHFLQTQVPQIDANVLSDIELEAQYLAASVDNLLENLTNLLHSISSITADNVEVHRNAVNKLTDSMDANIKCMYTIMAKTEEITKSMRPTEKIGERIREIKSLVDVLDSTM